MKFGLFDHVDSSARTLTRHYDDRIALVAAADAAGFYGYHVAEHHATPLNMVPIPSVYLAALSRVTSRIRLGTLCYLLPLYSPLRLVEELCMLDHLSHGRFDVGIGRGVSPFELNLHKTDPETAREVFAEAFAAVIAGLTEEKFTFAGKHFTYTGVPIELKPLQRPHPPIWYPSSSQSGARWAGERGLHFVTLGAVERAKANVASYRDALATRGAPLVSSADFPGGSAIGIVRDIVIADSVAAARKIAAPAYARWYRSLTKLERENAAPHVTQAFYEDIDEAIEKGVVILGTPDEVRAEIARQEAAIGFNYLLGAFCFGDMAQDDALRSLDLFAREVAPRVG